MRKKNNPANSIRTVVATGIGAAVIFVLMKFVQIPTPAPNTQVNVAMGFLALLGAIFGPVAAGLAIFIGHILNDFVTYGAPWWTWVVVDGFVGFALGAICPWLRIKDGVLGPWKLIGFNVYQTVINFIAWVLLAPTGDILIYHEPAGKVYFQGITTWLVDSISVAVIGTTLLVLYARTRTRRGSLVKEP